MQKHPSLPSWLHGREDHQAGRQFGPWHLTPWHLVFDSRWIRSKLCIPVHKNPLIYPISTPSNVACQISTKHLSRSGGFFLVSQNRSQDAVGFTDLTFFLLQIFLNAQGIPGSPESPGRKLLWSDLGDGLTGRPKKASFQCWWILKFGGILFSSSELNRKSNEDSQQEGGKLTITGTKCKISPSNRKKDIAYIYWGQCNNRVQWNQINPESTATIIGYST